jgi:hypothetical protein
MQPPLLPQLPQFPQQPPHPLISYLLIFFCIISGSPEKVNLSLAYWNTLC